MKKKKLLFTAIAVFGLATISMAQVPSYVPTSGLVSWWPFTGNANDESGNGNNGTIMGGITYISDRFATSNSAIQCANVTDIICTANSYDNPQVFSISLWFSTTTAGYIFGFDDGQCTHNFLWDRYIYVNSSGNIVFRVYPGSEQLCTTSGNYLDGLWHHIVCKLSSVGMQIYVDGVLTAENLSVSSAQVYTGYWRVGGLNNATVIPAMLGKVDDIGIWNRALTQQEITDLYNGCPLAVSVQPTNQSVNISNNAQFIVSSSDPSATYQWQTDIGVGFQNLSNAGQYSGTINDTLNVSNVTMSNNNQVFRCIITSGSCTDTSDVAFLTVVDNVGINEFEKGLLFSVYPNPAKSVINVKADSKLVGATYIVYDNTGKAVLSGKIISENTVLELGNLSGGVYLFSMGEMMKQIFKIIKE